MRKINKTAKTLINELELEPHPEGGLYKQTYRSKDTITPPKRFGGNTRSVSTTIFYLLEGGDFSAWHRINSDETWHYNAGCSLTLYIIGEDRKLKRIILGNPMNEKEAVYHYCIAHSQWFCAVPNDPASFTLATCTVSPGFEFRDFEMGDRKTLLFDYSQDEAIKDLILKFTRPTHED